MLYKKFKLKVRLTGQLADSREKTVCIQHETRNSVKKCTTCSAENARLDFV
jgi:hypothetical protein